MSITGAVYAVAGRSVRDRIAALAGPSDTLVEAGGSIVLVRSGPCVTIHKGSSESPWELHVLDGSPLVLESDALRRPNDEDLRALMVSAGGDGAAELLGQYALLRIGPDTAELRTDPNDLRSFYVHRAKSYMLFASRFHDVTRLTRDLELDFERFGSHWLAHNQLSNTFFVRGLRRISGGCGLDLRAGKSSVEEHEWAKPPQAVFAQAGNRPDLAVGDTAEAAGDSLALVRSFFAASNDPICLALSGGIDSRLLLALATHAGTGNVRAVTYASTGKVDASLALRLAETAAVPCEVLEEAPLRMAISNGMAAKFARENMCISPLSACTHLIHYDRLYRDNPGCIVVDGALGELGRARFYRGVEVYRRLNARAFRERGRVSDAFRAGVMRALSLQRVDVFSDEAGRLMEIGFAADTEAFIIALRNATSSRPEDLLGLRYRRANFFGHAQSWLDRFGFNAMPLGQQPVAHALLSVPLRKRRGGMLYRDTIRRYAPALAHIPLAKGARRYPFAMPESVVAVFAALGRLSRRSRTAPSSGWNAERDFVGDLIRSSETRSFGAYDHKKLDALFEDCYGGGVARFSQLDWWLSFELWRREHGLV